MRVSLALSHETAWLVHHALDCDRANCHQARRIWDYGITEPGISVRVLASRVRTCLAAFGVPVGEQRQLDVSVSSVSQRTRSKEFRAHVVGTAIASQDLFELAKGLYVVRSELCFIQASAWMEPLELLEFGYEICGAYSFELARSAGDIDGKEGSGGEETAGGEVGEEGGQETRDKVTALLAAGYRECPHATTTARIRACADRYPGMRGVRKARRALARIRDGSRSPMESALALMVVCNRDDGGLGYRNVEMNHRIDVPKEYRPLCASSYFEVDVWFPAVGAGAEYDGGAHAELGRRTHDSDRVSVLAAMGIPIRTFTAKHFDNQLELHRALNALAWNLSIPLKPTAEFQKKQNALRLFLIRNWK